MVAVYAKVCFLFPDVCVCVCVWLITSGGVSAATLSLSQIPVGKVITINGQQFVKINTDQNQGSQFLSLKVAPLCQENQFDGTTMQDFTTANCDCLPTPAPLDYILAGIMTDERDGKSYEVRKFADGKCWMVDNLRYGGAIDNCVGVNGAGFMDATYGSSSGMATPSHRFGADTYGNCRDPAVGAATTSPCYNSTACGYYYNWQAVMQLSSNYFGAAISYPHGWPSKTNFYQGICPAGWHVPSGGYTVAPSSEFDTLDFVNGGPGGTQNLCTTDSCNFWRPGGNWKGIYSGLGGNADGGLRNHGTSAYFATATGRDTNSTFNILITNETSHIMFGQYNVKSFGYSVRCLKD